MYSLFAIPFVLIVLMVFLGYFSAKLKANASFVKTGTLELVVAGATLIKVLVNVPNYYWDKKTRKLVRGPDPYLGLFGLGRYLRRNWGFFWVSLLYPARAVLQFDLPSSDRLKSESELSDKFQIKDRIEFVTERPANYLLWQMPHPVFVPSVELGGDGAFVDFLVNVMLQVDNPGQAILIHDANFFKTINSAVQGAVNDMAKNLTYKTLRSKAKGPGDPDIRSMLLAVNGKTSPAGVGTIQEFTGVMIVDGWLVDYGLTGASLTIQNAAQDAEVKRYEADAAREQAKGDADAMTTRAAAEAGRYAKLAEALTSKGASGDAAALVVGTQVRTENVAKAPNLTTYVEGGASTVVAVPANQPKPTPPVQP